jgi:hypothetical protein
VFQVLCLPFKFGGAFFYATPKLTHSLGIVNLVTLWAMCHFKFGGGIDFWNLFAVYVCKFFCVIFFLLKTKKLQCWIDRTTLRSIADTGMRLNSLPLVRAQRPISHTHSCMNAIERTLVQSIALVLNPHVTLFRSLSSLSPSFSHLHHTSSLPHLLHFSHIPYT